MSRATNLTRIDILGSAEKLIWDMLVLIVKYLATVAALVLIPAVFTVWPLRVFWRDSADYLWFTWVAAIIYWATPFSCAFYMLILCHWHSIRQWQREGKDLGIMGSNWRAAHGGIVCTTLKSFFFMFVGLVGSFFFEILYIRTSKYIGIDLYLPDHGTEITLKYALGYALLPTAAFTPVILLLLSRYICRDKYTTETKTERDGVSGRYRQEKTHTVHREERRETDAKTGRELELLRLIDAQIARIAGEQRG